MEGEEDGLAVALLVVVVAATDQPCSEVKEMGVFTLVFVL